MPTSLSDLELDPNKKLGTATRRRTLTASAAARQATTGQTIHAEAAHEDARFYPEVRGLAAVQKLRIAER